MRRTRGNGFKRRQRELNEFLGSLPRRMHTKFVETTPIRSGNARNKTALAGNEIQANYPYAKRLEKDSWSRQAPEGMSKPTIDFVRRELRKL